MMPLPPEEFELLSAYLDNALTQRQRQALEARLADSPELRAQLDDLRAVRAILRAAPILKPPRDFRLDPARYARRAWWSRLELVQRASALSAAAAVLLIALGILLASAPNIPRSSIALQATAINTPTPTAQMLSPTPLLPMAGQPMLTQAAQTATPEIALEAAMLMATAAPDDAPDDASESAPTDEPEVRGAPELADAASETALSPVARLLIVLGALLLIIGGVLFFIGTFRIRT